MDENFVSYLAFESVTARQERTIKRLWITNLVLIAALLVAVGGLFYEARQYETVETTSVSQDVTGANCATIIGIGDINDEDTPNCDKNQD